MAFALTNTHFFFGAGAPSYELLLAELRHHDGWLLADDVVGALQSRAGHWVALRKEDGRVWLLDSLEAPKLLTIAELNQLLKDYPRTYALRRLGEQAL